MTKITCVDLFCGAGGLTHGLVKEGIPVVAGTDLDPACAYPYEANNPGRFLERDVRNLTSEELGQLYGEADIRVLAGCAPCQPFSTYAQRYELADKDGKRDLLYEFARLVEGVQPHIIAMENVPSLAKHKVFQDFVDGLKRLDYSVWFDVVDSSRYGVPQMRKRMILLASKFGAIQIIAPTCGTPKNVKQAIGQLRPLQAGESDPTDKLHVAAPLSQKNLERIKASKPGGTWRDWPKDLVVE